MRLDLNRVGVERQLELLLDDGLGEGFPVVLGPGRQVGVEVADRTVHLGQRLDRGDARTRRLQPGDDVGDLLAHRRRAGRLAMGAAQHRHGRELMGHLAQRRDDAVQRRQHHLVARGLQHQRMAGVVDVLTRAGEMHELGGRLQLGMAREAALDPVLDRLHVVVGGALDGLDGLGIGFAELLDEAAQPRARRAGQRLELLEPGVAQRDEPLDLDLHAAVHQAVLGQQRAQRGHLGGIAAIQRRQGADRVEIEGGHGSRAGRGKPGILVLGAHPRCWRMACTGPPGHARAWASCRRRSRPIPATGGRPADTLAAAPTAGKPRMEVCRHQPTGLFHERLRTGRWLESFRLVTPCLPYDRDEVDRISHQPLCAQGAHRDGREEARLPAGA
mmetsp:Transcript_20688/g.38750  ORF Transcript_20688/g.38750 Transcript_20688/m.38750 type:complete len:387 (-) Transcript_20688:605-1765(-)